MKIWSKEELSGVCSICGDTIAGHDHTECAAAKKEMYGESRINKHPLKRYSSRKKEQFADYCSKRFGA